MSAPRKIIYLSQDGASLSVGPPRDDDWKRSAHIYHHDDVVRELVEALEFYADRKFTGYEVDISDYGLSMTKGEIILDEGDVARAALAKIAQEEEDLNRIADDRKDGPFVPVDLRDL